MNFDNFGLTVDSRYSLQERTFNLIFNFVSQKRIENSLDVY